MTAKSFIHPTAIIEKGAVIQDPVTVGPYAYIGSQVVLEKNVKIHSHVVVVGKTHVGENTEIFSFACIGNSPQYVGDFGTEGMIKIGTHNAIREYVTIHPGTKKGGNLTTIGNHCMLMANAHVAHDCRVGNYVWMANSANLGGHVTVGDYVIIGGVSGIHQGSRLGSGAIIGGLSGVEGDVIPYGHVKGNRATLDGLNIVGLKRRGVSREEIHALRAAYRLLFANEGTFSERIQDVVELFSNEHKVMEIIAFVQENAKPGSRPLCLPNYV